MGIFLLRGSQLIAICLLSIFLPVPVYPVFFMATGILLVLGTQSTYFQPRKSLLWIGILAVFLVNLVVVNYIRSKPLFSPETFKPYVNLFFLACFLIWSNSTNFIPRDISLLAKVFAFIISLSTFQVVLNVAKMNLWVAPFGGIKNSMDAYQITAPGVYWGIPEKNIWATKIVFCQILLLFMIFRKIIKVDLRAKAFIYIFCATNVIYTFSRTAQAVFLLFLLWELFLCKISARKLIQSPFTLMLSGVAISAIIFFAYTKLFHFSLKPGDGMESRVRMWAYLWYETNWGEAVVGNGILYAKDFLPQFGMIESNFHNAFLNTFMDFGIIGLLSFLLLILLPFCKKTFSLFIYLAACMSFQYLGYDNDVVVYIGVVAILGRFMRTLTLHSESEKPTSFNLNRLPLRAS